LKVGALNGFCFLANVFFLLTVKRIDNQQWRTTHNNATTCFEKDTPWQILLPYEDKIQLFFWSLVGCQCGSMEISEVVFNHSSQAKKKFLNNDDNLGWNVRKSESIKDAINTNFIWGPKLRWLVAFSPSNNKMLSYVTKNMKPH
jgi:hypothetical protein